MLRDIASSLNYFAALIYRLSIPFRMVEPGERIIHKISVWLKLLFFFLSFCLTGFSNNWLSFIILFPRNELPVIEFGLLHQAEENKLDVGYWFFTLKV